MSEIIKYKGVTILRNEHVALKDIDLRVGTGEFVYLLGRVGIGKTSLMKSLYAEVPVASG
ncbi:MAG: ATP-binding cassette domain-containing protein, partial [Muribaculaceae bacterium]|nr:ATP-binding cassette domain-containing protein [Muribaculaceae bacterium]